MLAAIDHISGKRTTLAVPGPAPDRFRAMLGLIDGICDLALGQGVRPAVRQHAGCCVETDDELEAALAAIEAERLGLCVDTGHMAHAGLDPAAVPRRHAARTTRLHPEEVDADVLDRVRMERIPFLPATALGVFCPLGRGVLDWPAVAVAVAEIGYAHRASPSRPGLADRARPPSAWRERARSCSG